MFGPGTRRRGARLALLGLWVTGGLGTGCELPNRPTSTVVGYETNDLACDDGFDNDQDGLVDCEDPDCTYSSHLCGEQIPLSPPRFLVPEATPRLCHDGIDNDDNGFTDCDDLRLTRAMHGRDRLRRAPC